MIIVKFDRFRETFPNRVLEWLLASILFNWGWILLLPYETFDLRTMVNFRLLAPEWAWGTACLCIGMGRLVTLWINGSWRRSPHARGIFAILSCLAWAHIFLALVTVGIVAPGQSTYATLFLAELYVIVRAFSEARVADEAFGVTRRSA